MFATRLPLLWKCLPFSKSFENTLHEDSAREGESSLRLFEESHWSLGLRQMIPW